MGSATVNKADSPDSHWLQYHTDGHDLIGNVISNQSNFKAYEEPNIPSDKCTVDLSQYPQLTLSWKAGQGPALGKGFGTARGEAAILIGQETCLPDPDRPRFSCLDPKTAFVIDYTTEKKTFDRKIEMVFVIDNSGSMTDNATLTNNILQKLKVQTTSNNISAQYITYSDREIKANGTRVHSSKCSGNEELHAAALDTAVSLFKERGSTRYVILITDEGQKCFGGDQELNRVSNTYKRNNIQSFLIYDPYTRSSYDSDVYTSSENFNSLKEFATRTNGQAIPLSPNKSLSANLWTTQYSQSRLTSVTFIDAEPDVAANRYYHVINGAGAMCQVEIRPENITGYTAGTTSSFVDSVLAVFGLH